jgi:CubicO group peptidase (beta-lactamase class C family)
MRRSPLARRAAAAALLLAPACSAPPLGAQPAPAGVTPAQGAAIDSFVRRTMQARRVPGVAVAVVQDGHVVYRRAFGVANLETATPLAPDAVFELASVTKEFTAAAIMMLVEAGKVGLDTPVTAYVDSAPAAWSAITVRHLLTHTSGIFAGGVVQWQGSPLLAVTTRQAFQQIAGARTFGPGEVGVYSDAGYFLLGMVIERASGQTYRDFLQRRVFDPLGMTRTSLTDRRRVLPGRVATYEIAAGGGQLVNWRRDWDYELPSFFGIWSTLDDVARWDTALRRHTLLTPASLEQMWTPGRLNDGRDALVDGREYGFGFRVDEIRGHRMVWHNGASGTIVLHLLEEPLTVIVLTNLANTAGRHATTLGRGIVGLLRPQLAPVQTLAPRADPAPERTRALSALLADVAAGRESPTMTAAHAAYFRGLPPIARDPLGAQLAGLGPLAFLGCDEVAGKGIRITDPIERICHYRAEAGGRPTWFTFWLTREGKAAHLRLAGADDY